MTEVVVKRRRLHAGQTRLSASPKRFRVAMFGRRWGKNVAAIDEAMTDALNGLAVGWFEPGYKYLLEAWRDLAQRLRPVQKHTSEQDKRIELLTGGLVEMWTADNPDAGRGRSYDKVIVNEAGIIRGLTNLWQQAIRPTLADRRGRALFLGTPKGRTHDFSQMFSRAEQDPVDWEAFRGPTSENPYIPKDEIEAAQAELPPAIFAQEFLGIPADDGGNPFGIDSILASVGPLGTDVPICWGWDFARAQDWTVGIALDQHYRVVGFHRWQHVPWGETKAMVASYNKAVPAWGDSTGVGDAVVEDLQRAGVPMIGVPFSRPMKQQLMERLAGAIQQRKLTYPDGVIRSELETFGYEYTASGVRYEAPDGLHDDCVVALALAVYGRDQFGEFPASVPVPENLENKHPGFDYDGKTRKKWYEPEEDNTESKWLPSRERVRL